MKKTIILLSCLLLSLLQLQGAEQPRERVYISTDKEVYVAGDAVWLSAWCLDTADGRLSEFSKIAYVELHSPTGMVQTAKVALEGGRGAGRLMLPTTLPTGNYRLFAYTRLGASEEGFDPLTGARTLSVFNIFSTERTAGVKVVGEAPQAAASPTDGTLEIRTAPTPRKQVSTVTLTNRGTQPVDFCLSVRHDDGIPAPAGARLADFVSAVKALPAARGFDASVIPEYEGEIIRCRVTGTDEDGLEALQGKHIFLSAPGSGENLYTETLEHGSSSFFTANIYGDRELFLEIEGLDQKDGGHLELESPFLDLPAGEIPPLQLWSGWASALELRGLGMQLGKTFDAEGLYDHLDVNAHQIFDLRERVRYVLDDYRRFPLMEELFIEFISEIRVRRVGGKRELQIRMPDHNGSSYFPTSSALVLLDGIPVLDHERMLAYDPLLVQYVDIYEGSYFFGTRNYAGVVNFVTYKGTLPSMQFADNVRIVDFQGCGLPVAFGLTDFGAGSGVPAGCPDYRQTLCWLPAMTLAPGESFTFKCKTPAYGGRFDIVAEGLDAQGGAVSGRATLDAR